jgi:hypothetical protein
MSLSQNARATSGSSNSAWKYIESQAAGQYVQDAGNHYFKYAASGSADGTITWKEPLSIHTDGQIHFNPVATAATGTGLIAHHTNNNMYIRGGTEGMQLIGGSTSEANQGYVNIPGGNNNMDFGISGTTRFRIRHDGTTFMGPNTSGQIHIMYNSSGAVMADDATVTLSGVANTGCLIAIGSYYGSGGGARYAHALIFGGYNIGATPMTIISDPVGIIRNSDTDNYLCVYKAQGSGNVTVKNRLGVSSNISITVHRYQGL